MSTISAGTTNSTALVETGDTTGNLIIQANTSTTVGTFSSTGLAVVGSLSATSGYNGTVGATTPSTGAFTTVSASGLLTAPKTGQVAIFGDITSNAGSYVTIGGTLSTKNWVIANNMIVGAEFGIGLTSAAGGTTIGSSYSFTIFGNETIRTVSTVSVGNATPSTSGAGITFPATQSASTDANTLDDYEEGTFTPTIGGTTVTGTATYAYQLGYYTKVGRMVYIQGYIEWSAGNGSGAGMRMNGLPFSSNANADSPISSQPNNITASALTIVNMNVRGGGTAAQFLEQPVGTGTMGNCAYDVAGSTYFAGTYWV